MAGQKDGFSGERAVILPPISIAEMEKDPLGSMLYITDIGYYPVAKNHFRKRTESIPQWVLIYCRSGKGWFSIGNRRYEVGPDSYFVLPADVAHAYGADGSDPWTIYWVHYRGSMASKLLPASGEPVTLRVDTTNRIAERIALFEEILSTLEHGYSREALLYAGATLSYFLSTLKYINCYSGVANLRGGQADGNPTNMVDAAINYMTENIEKPIRMSDLAEYVGLTGTYLSHLFSSQTGMSPMRYLRQLRVSQACRLLDFTSLQINQICHKVGIDDPYYFSRIFTSTMGVAPSEYRKRPKG